MAAVRLEVLREVAAVARRHDLVAQVVDALAAAHAHVLARRRVERVEARALVGVAVSEREADRGRLGADEDGERVVEVPLFRFFWFGGGGCLGGWFWVCIYVCVLGGKEAGLGEKTMGGAAAR